MSFKVREVAGLISKTVVEYRLVTYSSTESCENGILSSCLGEAENERMIHKNRAMVRATLRAVRLDAASWLLL